MAVSEEECSSANSRSSSSSHLQQLSLPLQVPPPWHRHSSGPKRSHPLPQLPRHCFWQDSPPPPFSLPVLVLVLILVELETEMIRYVILDISGEIDNWFSLSATKCTGFFL
ncbi:hypothetical protein ABKV19_020667 [Rosa sericea]